MNVRDTSIEAYNKIKKSGLLSELLLDHLEVFYFQGTAMTAREAHQVYVWRYKAEPNLNQFRSKITMLVDQGALEELDEKIEDEKTGMRVTKYFPTGTATEKPKKVSKKDRKELAQTLLKSVAVELDEKQKEVLRKVYRLIDTL